VSPHPFQAAMESAGEYAGLLAPDVQLHSPVLHAPFVGRDTVEPLLPVLRGCFTDPEYTDELHAPGTLGLVFRARIDGLDAEGVQVLRLDDDGLVEDITVLLRPIRAAMALSQAMGPRVAKQDDGTWGLADA
jgi:hypothetical protein